ncbi:acetyl-CoA carboxylase, biotin carboxyl carrier protein [Sporanaerobium hydrogeniformans]|uniref:Acetyl-CoA carboxylase, biotin carboxyl carrier protein n=1 Tax=Sporanaerobium hydrogeniformans TaxID=3072179 RepID=A0AC61DAW2_9FIRM|nr:acetyl-CoA carboxylase biotin carboxyl carrier protein [Sporanaerobium hydrogeniformans]PHV70414.1 acetyl-CoA carboxylase, biotin carboxyl carrier protein [Sporanaerobium hydrogeniformans]
MEVKVIKDLVKEFTVAGLTKMSLKCEDFELVLEKQEAKEVYMPAPMPEASIKINTISASSENKSESNKQVAEEKKTLNSPMVGTFYAASSPQAEPFVKVGTKVKKGQVICIIEAMKLMNEVEAEMDGEVIEVLAYNEQMVEFGQPLFVIK